MSGIIHVDNNLHIISARAEVRTLARTLGFNTVEQARISLATSSLAYIMDLGGRYDGQIRFSSLHENGAMTLQVICVAYCRDTPLDLEQVKARELSKVRQMVDELHIEALPSKDVQVIILKRREGKEDAVVA